MGKRVRYTAVDHYYETPFIKGNIYEAEREDDRLYWFTTANGQKVCAAKCSFEIVNTPVKEKEDDKIIIL